MSFEVGSRKPEKKIFRVLLSKYHLKPAECVFIDDRDFNLVPAKEIGLKTILFKNPKQLEKDLRKIGVVF
jgi:HAD superfamily hydrolase (TIGR01509 family)